jgi:hypothetical protein
MTARLAYALTGIARRMAHASLTLQAAIEAAHVAAHGQPSISARPRVLARADGGSSTGGAGSGTGGAEVAEVVDQFADGVEAAARVIAGSLRSLRPPGDMPPLRERQTAIYEQLTGPAIAAPAEGAAEGAAEAGATTAVAAALAGPPEVLTGSTDEFTDALDTAADVLQRRLNG